MPPRKKSDTEVEAVKPPRPKHLSELCSECGQHEVHPDYAAWSCEHGTWNLADDFDNEAAAEAEPVSEEDARAGVLASLTDEELQALLEARTAGSTPPGE